MFLAIYGTVRVPLSPHFQGHSLSLGSLNSATASDRFSPSRLSNPANLSASRAVRAIFAVSAARAFAGSSDRSERRSDGCDGRNRGRPGGTQDCEAVPRATAVAAAVDSAVERYGITADLLADAMARLAFTDLDQLCAWGTVMEHGKRRSWLHLHDSTAIERPALAAISEIRRSAGGELSVKLFNKREAIMDLARLKGWIADKPVDQRSLVMLKIER
jgi:hypothetical protein